MASRGAALALLLVAVGCRSTTTRRAADVVTSLVGTTWVADGIEGAGVLAGVPSTLTFESAERVVGSTGCNQYFAPLTLVGTALRFGPAGSTRRACSPAIMDQERRFLAALETVRTYRVHDGVLSLLDEDARDLIRFTRAR